MKKIFISIFFMFVLMWPINIYGLSEYTYDEAIGIANGFHNTYPYSHDLVTSDTHRYFRLDISGNHLIQEENLLWETNDDGSYKIANTSFWLMAGQSYWLDGGKVATRYGIKDGSVSGAKVRVVEYLNDDVCISGSGTYKEPWKFSECSAS